jgi:hypothetical protein
LLLLAAPGSALAAMPVGSHSIQLGDDQSVWLLAPADPDPFCEGFEDGFGAEPDACTFSLFIDAKGKITGSVQIAADNGNVVLNLSGPIKGKQKGSSDGATKLSFSAKLSGEANGGGDDVTLTANIAFDGEIEDGLLVGSWSYKLCAKGESCFQAEDAIPAELLDGGSWTLDLEVISLGNDRLGGEAIATFSDGSQCTFALDGKYNAKKDVSSLKLSPDDCDGASLQLKNVRFVGDLTGDLKYKLFGAKGNAFVEAH